MSFDISDISNMVGEEQAMNWIQNLDDEQIDKMATVVVEEFIAPALIQIRQNAKAYRNQGEGRKQVRQQYENMSQEDQLQRFHNAMAELRQTAEMLRHQPKQGVQKSREIIRNPWYHEAILLAFDIEEFETEPKEFFTYTGRWVLMGIIPEAYTEAEARDLIDEMFEDTTYEEVLSKHQKERLGGN